MDMTKSWIRSYNQFNSITECCIEKPTKCLSKGNCQLFGSKRKKRCKWYDCNKVEDELKSWRPLHYTGNNSNWHEYQQHIHIVCFEDLPCQMKDEEGISYCDIVVLVVWCTRIGSGYSMQ